MVNKPTDKFQITREPLLPHKCGFCGKDWTGSNEFIDGNTSFDYYGAFLICMPCAEEIARTIGFITTEERDEAILFAHSLENELDETKKHVTVLDGVIADYYSGRISESVRESDVHDDNVQSLAAGGFELSADSE